MTQTIEIKVPDIGDFHDVPVIELHVKAGDKVALEAPLVTLESDKATMDVPASAAGLVKAVKVKVGDKVSRGSVIALLETDAAPARAQPAQAPAAPVAAPQALATPAPAPTVPASEPAAPAEAAARPALPATAGRTHASPSVRAFARELGADIAQVRGSGPKGRVLRDDVATFIKGEMSKPRDLGALALGAMPAVDFAKWGPVELRPLSRIKKLSGANLHRAWVGVPHVTQHDLADITELEAFRQRMNAEAGKDGVKLTLLAFLLKAAASALHRHPEFNASLENGGENLVLKRYIHIGVAVDTPDGLVVPVIRDVDRKGILDLARELGEVSQKARDKKLGPAEMQGGCFTISSLGGIGGTAFTPIINAPEVAILGVSRASHQPVWDGGQFQPRLMLPLSLSYDHRVIDGAAAARFTTDLARLLADLRRALL